MIADGHLTGQDHTPIILAGVFVNVPHDTEEARIERFLTLLYKDNILARKVASLLALRREAAMKWKYPT